MKNQSTHRCFIAGAALCSAVLLSGCVELADNGGGPSYDDYSYGYDSDYRRRDALERERDRARRERHELREERERAEEERERLERERERHAHLPPPPPPPRREERCPSGFSPSENKCSKEERRRGCQDMRLPGGLGCVKR